MDLRPPPTKRLSATVHEKDRVWIFVPQPIERQRIGNQIDAALSFARTDFVKMLRIGHFRERPA